MTGVLAVESDVGHYVFGKYYRKMLETQCSHFGGKLFHFCASVISYVEQGGMKTK